MPRNQDGIIEKRHTLGKRTMGTTSWNIQGIHIKLKELFDQVHPMNII